MEQCIAIIALSGHVLLRLFYDCGCASVFIFAVFAHKFPIYFVERPVQSISKEAD
jgi:hypothetical protein